MKRVIVTGGTGFVGANLARRLVHDGHEVHLFVRPDHRTWRIAEIADTVALHVVDLRDSAALAAQMRAIRPDWLFHLAVHGAYSWQADVHQIIQTNVVGTTNLVEVACAVGFEAFVNTGSSSEYGAKDHAPSETEWLEPNSVYAVAKASATLFCRHIAQQRGVQIPTLRLYSVYGPYEEPARLIPSIIVRGLRGALPPLAAPEIARDYVYVDDVVDAYLRAATQPQQDPGAVYNVGTGVQTTLRQVVAVARKTFDITAEPVWGSMAARQWDTIVWVANSAAIQAALGWSPRASFAEGFRRTAAWLQTTPLRAAQYER